MTDVASCDANIQTAVLEALSEGLAAALILYDRHDHIIFASQSVLQFFPVPRGMLAAGTRLRDFLGAVYDSGVRFAMGAAADRAGGRESWLSEQIARHWKERVDSVERFGQDRWVRFVHRRLPSGYGICQVRDVSEETRREAQWRLDVERVQLTEEILDNLPFAISVKDRALEYAAVNRAMCSLFGREPEDIIGRTDRELHAPELASLFELSDRRVLGSGTPAVFPEHIRGAAGEELLFVTHKLRVGKPGRYFLVTVPQDVTGLGRSAGVDPALPASGVGDPPSPLDFTTLNVHYGQRILLVTADRNLEARGLKVLGRLGFDCCSVRNEAELEAFLDVAGTASVTVDLVVLDSDMNMACLELVERHGIEALALDGWQISNELAFSVARALNGIKARKETPPQDIPELVPAVPAAHAPDSERVVHGLDVLVVEDNDINRIVFSQILDGLGFSHIVAGSGEEALTLWREKSPRVILMDTTLPDVPGTDVAATIRRQEAVVGGRVPIVGVLARAVDGDREACLAAGMDDVILKPVSPDMIGGVVRRFFCEGITGVAL